MKFCRRHIFVFLAWNGKRRLDIQRVTPLPPPSRSISSTLPPSTLSSNRIPSPPLVRGQGKQEHQIFRPSLENLLDRPPPCCVFVGWRTSRYSRVLTLLYCWLLLSLAESAIVIPATTCHDGLEQAGVLNFPPSVHRTSCVM